MIKKRRQQNETVISVKLVTAKGLTMEFFYQKGYRQADIVKTGINYNMSTKRVSTEKIATEKITTKNVSAKAYRLKRYRIKRYRQKRKKKDLTIS